VSRHILYCAACAASWVVSEEDPDATLSEALEHATAQHPGKDPIMTIKERQNGR